MTIRLRTAEELPHDIVEIEHTWIPMSDGCRLAARIWHPEGAGHRPVPAILEYIPYRKRDGTAERDEIAHRYFAGHGYAGVRVDLRGSGDSEGLLQDEYLEEELVDCEEVLRWIAGQPWCDGRVGMYGKSWGGFNGLQVAARRPDELKAVITVCSTDDRYADDIHYMGGCLLGDNLSWASAMFTLNSTPPDPEIVGDRWRQMWMDRLEHNEFWLETWLRHQRRDDFWKHGSICENYSAVEVPVLAVSGWADGYSNAVFRLMARLSCPRAGLLGPWGHRYPHRGVPGPAIGFLQEALRWWDRWLKDEDTGVDRESMLKVWMQDSVPPNMYAEMQPGRWVTEPTWPSPRIENHVLTLAHDRLVDEDAGTTSGVVREPLSIQSPLSVGLFGGKWCSFSATPDLPHDQREEDGGALVFESRPLDDAIELLGAPALELRLSADRPVAMVCARLSDVAPDGKATRVTYGLLNLTHRDGHEHPQPLEPGRSYRVRMRLNGIAHAFSPRHRLRLSLSTSYWPIAWPSPEAVTLTVITGSSRLLLPIRRPRPEDDDLRAFPEPEGAVPNPVDLVEPRDYEWVVIRDLAKDTSTLRVLKDEGVLRHRKLGDLVVHRRTEERYSYTGFDHDSPTGRVEAIRAFTRGSWSARSVVRTSLTCDKESFHVHADLNAYEGDRRVFCSTSEASVPRDLV